jgi:hypothetical protein
MFEYQDKMGWISFAPLWGHKANTKALVQGPSKPRNISVAQCPAIRRALSSAAAGATSLAESMVSA